MQIIEDPEKKAGEQGTQSSGITVAILLIVGGIVYLLRNLGLIQSVWMERFISWQGLLILIGAAALLKRHYLGGVILLFLGSYFLFPEWNALIADQLHTYWPLLLVAVGLRLLVKRKEEVLRGDSNQTNVEDGFVRSATSFTTVQQIVLDKTFKGADISISMGNIILDLRKTSLEKPVTVIRVHSTCANVIIHTPEDWIVRTDVQLLFSGNRDLRTHLNGSCDQAHTLLIQGRLSFAGLEIRN